ncbi:hypothetical protein [Paraflavitalea sp. CAU 1676]|uniref:hypothetical protein n=1 Tax=Paraflavitalea sp. CAU 1676 TaxID=3032598 RepID=UPI0023DBF741|nr:hypothetical protein [Paraflavitalea sp. CAU 1676]MDF2191006.1 hypothetical protein [Paraflavitalea sp. CAU 1676]
MKTFILLITILVSTFSLFSQQSDFLVLKKRNNRTIKTYYTGAFISGETHNGFRINGFITDIRNDSVFFRQEERQQVGTDFGTTLDTVVYHLGIDYREIKRYNYSDKYVWGGKKGFVQVALPKIMMIGGVGYIILESVNTIYRKESFSDDGKLLGMGIAAGIAVAGYLMQHYQDRNRDAGRRYKVVYVKAADVKKGF